MNTKEWLIKLTIAIGALLLVEQAVAVERDSTNRETKNSCQLDFREHRGYTGWSRLTPTHLKAQYAGGMGFMSFGFGWDYGRKCRWESDILFGFLPKAYSDEFHMTFTFKQNYIPWSIRCCSRFAIEPISCGVYLNWISGKDYWIREPDRYPERSYYGFSTKLRAHAFIGQRFTYYPKLKSLLHHITLFYEFSANELNIIAKCGNRKLSLSDVVNFSAGIKFQLMR